MNKAELVEAIADGAGLDKKQAAAALEATTSAIQAALESGDRVQLVGFGTWSVNERSARAGRNPATGESIQIASKKVVRFKPGATLANAVN